MLIVRTIIVCAVVVLSGQARGQVSSERVALNNVEKKKWDKAFAQLNKALTKDTLNAAAAYVMGCYFFAPENPEYQLDSAYRYTLKALRDFEVSTAKQRERLKRFPLDSLTIVDLKKEVDSAAFERAKQFDTEKSYVDFISNFPTADQLALAISLRDKAAYHETLITNTYQSFKDFIAKYPDSEQADDANTRYQELLFEDMTKDKRLKSYRDYVRAYPNSRHAPEAEKNILEITTADGSIDSYLRFIRDYPDSKLIRHANGILFHLLSEDQREDIFPYEQNSDSLNTIMELSRGYLVPFLHEGRFGFMNQQGAEVITAEADDLKKDYRCGNLTSDVFVLPHKLVGINGATIYNQSVEEVDDLGHGFLMVETDTCSMVIHKTGFVVGEKCVQNAKVINGKFLALQKDSMWSLWTLTGRMLLPFGWEDIQLSNDVIILKTKEKYAVTTTQSVAELADQHDLGLTEFVDEVRGWRNNFIWLRSGESEGVFTQRLDTVVAMQKQSLSQSYFGFIAKRTDGYYMLNGEGKMSQPFKQVAVLEPWTAVRRDSTWHLFDAASNEYRSSGYDSIYFAGPSAVAIRRDSTRIFFSPNSVINVVQPVRIEFIPGQQSFLLLEQGARKTVYNMDGKKLVVLNYDQVQFAGEGFFAVSKKDKKGLINSAGKLVLPIEYDAIGTVNKGIVSLLKGSKFGLFDCKTRKLIKPQYNKNLSCYNSNLIIAFKEGMVGFIGWDNKPLSRLQFNEVRFWNDSAAFVRKDSQWMLYSIKTQKPVLDKITNINFIEDGDDKLAIVQQDRRFGVIHNKKGIVIPINFSDIINVGSSEIPLYFTEKHVEEASIFVVIYYDSKGNMLRKEVYEHDDYEKIYCSNN